MPRLSRLAGVFITAWVTVCALDANTGNSRNPNAPAGKLQSDRKKLQNAPKADYQELGRRAEAFANEGSSLRQLQTEESLNAAITKFQRSTRLFKAAHLYGKAAESSLQSGEIYFTLSQYQDALGSYRAALKAAAHSPELTCLALSGMARTYAFIGQSSMADNYSNQALSHCNSLSDPKLQAEGLESRGEFLYNAGQGSKSMEFFSRAQILFKEARDESRQADSLLMSAFSRFHNNHGEALQFAAEALRLWSAGKNDYGVAQVRAALGTFATATDEFETAQCNFERALPVFQQFGDKDHEASVLNGMGRTNRKTGDLKASLENYTHAVAAFSKAGDKLGIVEAITGMGHALTAMHQDEKLLPLYERKLQLARETGNIGQEASALADMADVYKKEQQYARAEKLYKRARSTYQAGGLEYGVGDVLMRLARLQVERGDELQAISLLKDALARKEKTEQAEDIARINFELAEIYLLLNRMEDARASIEQTIKIIESQRLKIASFDSRAAYFSSVHRYYALYVHILMLLDQKYPGQGFAALAFEASEKSKVRALLDLLNASGKDSPCNDLLRKQLEVGASAAANSVNPEPAAVPPVLSLKQIQDELLDSETVLLEFMIGEKESYIWVADSRQIIAHNLRQPAKTRKMVQRFREVLTAREPRPGEISLDEYHKRVRRADAAYPRISLELSQLLLKQADLSRAKRLLIVPDGFLQYMPFSALPFPEDDKGNSFLINRCEIVVLPSASALNGLRKAAAKRDPATSTAVIIADPVVERDDDRVAHAHKRTRENVQQHPAALNMALRDAGEPQHISRLLGSRTEAEVIRQTLGQDVRVALGFDASRQFVLGGGLEHYRIIHFATHGIIDGLHPEMSGLILSLVNEKGQTQDGYLRLGDIYKLNLSADLVVLSACNSALGKDLESEGVIGLPRGFLYAGGRSVIASLWKVDDHAAAEFMKGFYAHIHRGENPSAAIRGAQFDMSQGSRWREPFYWAAFVLQGDYK